MTAITSTGSVIAAKRIGTVISNLFADFLINLIRFIKESEGIEPKDCLILLDNASVHRAGIVRNYMKNECLNV